MFKDKLVEGSGVETKHVIAIPIWKLLQNGAKDNKVVILSASEGSLARFKLNKVRRSNFLNSWRGRRVSPDSSG